MQFLGNSFQEFSVARVPEDADIVFVADMFVEDGILGGAELTSDALIKASPYKVFKIRSRDVGQLTLQTGANKKWIFGNFTQIQPNIFYKVLQTFAQNMSYCVLEYDYKYCVARSPEKHAEMAGKCDCPGGNHTRAIENFYANAKRVYWMSEKQRDACIRAMPALSASPGEVLSSVFSPETLVKLDLLRDARKTAGSVSDNWVVLGSNSWIKGYEKAVEYCKSNGLSYTVLSNLPYDELLSQLATNKGLVYLPPGGDTCPRLVIEAKLLGLELVLNENVQHKDESWFESIESCREYLAGSTNDFWTMIKHDMFTRSTLSGYMTTYQALSRGYPLRDAIKSLNFCDEICIADGGSTDGTLELLSSLSAELGSKLRVKVFGESDGLNSWSGPYFAVNDGKLKALARSMCTSDFCWQQDSDEILPAEDGQKVFTILERLPKAGKYTVALPIIEYWGLQGKVRVDVMPWKWRLSPNSPDITHGIPRQLRVLTETGETVAMQGTDGCDMIDTAGERVPLMNFYTQESHSDRMGFLSGNAEAGKRYSEWYKAVTTELPTVHHYSWVDFERKIRLYGDYWTRHWNSLYGQNLADTAETNMFFDKPWSQVSDQDISNLAKKLTDNTYGWIWHRKWTGQHVPGMTVWKSDPLDLIKTN